MDKSIIVSFVNKLKDKGIDNFVIRYENASRFSEANSESSRIYLADDHVIVLDVSNNYGSDKGRFNIRCISYDNIETITAPDLSTVEAIEMLKAEGCYDELFQDLIKKRGGRVRIKPVVPNTSKYGQEKETVVDEETQEESEVPVIKGDAPGMITTGYDK